ncbi:MAG: hypothetical protein AAF264_08830, partial [Pseudomonadota bacterium]
MTADASILGIEAGVWSLIFSTYWFAYFLVILPLLGVIEKPQPRPATIEQAFDDEHPAKTQAAGLTGGKAATPAE